MDFRESARSLAATLRMLNTEGELRSLGSLELIDFVIELEQATDLDIPSARAVAEHFASLETVAALLTQLASEQGKS